MQNCLICGLDKGIKVNWTFSHFNENLNSSVSEWTYGYTDKSWLTEEDAVYKAEALIHSEKTVTNIHVQKKLSDDTWIVVDLEKSPFAYHNKKPQH